MQTGLIVFVYSIFINGIRDKKLVEKLIKELIVSIESLATCQCQQPDCVHSFCSRKLPLSHMDEGNGVGFWEGEGDVSGSKMFYQIDISGFRHLTAGLHWGSSIWLHGMLSIWPRREGKIADSLGGSSKRLTVSQVVITSNVPLAECLLQEGVGHSSRHHSFPSPYCPFVRSTGHPSTPLLLLNLGQNQSQSHEGSVEFHRYSISTTPPSA
ncbi:hypothetical protein EGR_07782 [Echinococcus granulosus]|uniref:Uncharacterized protein n=1 Tax=Echinococcus granulosus TaxID=6210 RepID=W6UVC0_ECHGR|nr:hypothetical protein EGR_07782 [Echinococcus granulosus]EUB57389.1 hypothetical protein EGR_07782 [Echinococcus granulosus]